MGVSRFFVVVRYFSFIVYCWSCKVRCQCSPLSVRHGPIEITTIIIIIIIIEKDADFNSTAPDMLSVF